MRALLNQALTNLSQGRVKRLAGKRSRTDLSLCLALTRDFILG